MFSVVTVSAIILAKNTENRTLLKTVFVLIILPSHPIVIKKLNILYQIIKKKCNPSTAECTELQFSLETIEVHYDSTMYISMKVTENGHKK